MVCLRFATKLHRRLQTTVTGTWTAGLSCWRSPTALRWAHDVSGGGADQCHDRRSCPASGGPQISRRRQDDITNKYPIVMEKQRS
ncbi:hypothetical protein TIFTF001_016930 [Ficus carica]|uniref:Uncharacterized protein n=1 Tax=Ficus carica TaxID=3494 RepID=A0AA88DA97_FICCA|nr:hypothetical protein TIFTF001_016930 [Ficus carica]